MTNQQWEIVKQIGYILNILAENRNVYSEFLSEQVGELNLAISIEHNEIHPEVENNG